MIDMKQEKKRVNKLRADTNITMDTLNYGDKVQLSSNGKNGIQGTIIVKDYQGGGLYYAICPSVDIQGDDSIFYKHVPIVDVELLKEERIYFEK